MFIASPVFAEKITIEIPDDKVSNYYQVYAILNNWQPTITIPADPNIEGDVDKQIPNPITIKQNFEMQIRTLIALPVVQYGLRVYKKNRDDQTKELLKAEKDRLDAETKIPDSKVGAIPKP